ncbi:M48 family metallopeptidase [Arcobacter sp. LA11]|uniref:M48 family metallopeptidase n=1 Tax=Arcobacter sp. LA11 TaxID=1898176 RepID=UPI000933DDA4|nr:M48 family metallopeptidase [Arcobacter sp. LA11]
MKYIQKLPDESVNVSKNNIFFETFKFLFSFLVLFAIVYFSLIGLSNLIVTNLSYENEKKLLTFIDFDINNTTEDKKLSKILEDLKLCTSLKNDLKVRVLESDIQNAFALPGGTIIVTSELLKNAKSDNELYFILGHELGHYINKDHLKRFGQSIVMMGLNLILPSDMNFLSSSSFQITNSKYSKEQEFEADKNGLNLMFCSLKDMTDAKSFFERINNIDKSSEFSYIFATHPHPLNRIENIESIINSLKQKN